MTAVTRGFNAVQAEVRASLRSALSQEKRNELKRIQGLARKRFAPVLSLLHGSFTANDLIKELEQKLPADFEILMVHSSFDRMVPMFKGTVNDLLAALLRFCGENRTLVMPAFVMGGRTFDTKEFFRTRPFDVRRTPSENGLMTEVFRRSPGVLRSLHPTCSVCAYGPRARELTTNHHLAETGLSPETPFGEMNRRRTSILGLGVEYYRCLTHAHTATYGMGDDFPVKFEKNAITVTLVDYDGNKINHTLGLPDRSKKLDLRLLWSVLTKQQLVEWRFHGVPMFVVPEAKVVTERLIEAARRGITIYGRAPVASTKLSTPEENSSRQ
jgi:aminoglycoside 3-N-acetyltransferase